ncbi:MAG: protein rep, partial [Acidobacteria bacterium]|nr:protein rep [Acidobacteriota bacterium]
MVADCCHDRMCLPCQQRRSETLAQNIVRWIGKRPCRMITLTIASSPASLAAQLDHLQDSYRRLRQRHAWKDRVQGAIGILEVTRNAETGHWHPHLHVLAWGSYWDQRHLSAEWEQASQGSRIVDIRLARSPEMIAKYAAKYVAKCLDASVYEDHPALCEYIRSMKGRRLVITSGDASSAHLTEELTEDDWCTL